MNINAPLTSTAERETERFSCNCYLANNELAIVEIKENSNYQMVISPLQTIWFKIDLLTYLASPLNLIAKDSSSQIEERYFAQGFLKYGELSGNFIEKFNLGQHTLTKNRVSELPPLLKKSIDQYLQKSENDLPFQISPQYSNYTFANSGKS